LELDNELLRLPTNR